MNELFRKISLVGIVPVVKIEDVEKAIPLAKALCSGGIPIAEVTFRTEQAEESISRILKKKIPIIPGCITPSEVEKAIELGLNVVKFFPAEAAGGIKMIKALSGPFGNIKFMPTGGINANNIDEYLSFSKVIACGGSWMVKEDLINSGDFERVTELSKEAMDKISTDRRIGG